MQGRLVAGRYRLGESIGSGGMGRVWRAHDEVLHRTVAVKELTAALYVSESDQAVLLARTRSEARAAARINHSAVVTVHDVLEHDGRPWIVMELVEGRSLADAVKENGRVEPREAARVGLWVLRALRAAHTAGVLHRDVKPGNVLLADDGRVLLTDFGIAQIEGDSTITRTGEVVGSVDYLAPERVRGHDPGPASDLWALGATLYTAVEGRSPFRRTSPLTTMQAVVEEEADDPLYAGPLAPVISALLRKDPADRPGVTETEQLLAEAAEGRRPDAAQAYVPTRYTGTGHGPARPADPGHSGTAAAQTPYPPVNGPTANGGTPPMGHPPAAGAPARPRRRLRTLALVVAVAALVGGGTAAVLQTQDKDGGTGPGAAAGPSPGPSAPASVPASPSASASSGEESPTGSVPAGWERHNDPLGFSLSLPPGWERQELEGGGTLRQVDYTPDGGHHFVRIAVDTAPDFDDPYAHQLDLEQQLQRLVDYRRLTLERSTYRDRASARWEYTWTALAKDPPYVAGPRRAVEEMYMSRDGVEYVIYMAAPAQDWPQASDRFDAVLRSWQEKPAP
ncbi:serine/threonine-protein kinase [Streptomyces sp. NPDC006367]|uniref:serine/threonine-protein kinase n=1 Tax=unclassified Streptomyces TaxID=2593676 RepID=UPI0033B9BB3E